MTQSRERGVRGWLGRIFDDPDRLRLDPRCEAPVRLQRWKIESKRSPRACAAPSHRGVLRICAPLLALWALFTPQAGWAKSIALIISNEAYQQWPRLDKPHGDARGYKEALEAKGFQVFSYPDLDSVGAQVALGEFTALIAPGDNVAFVFSGHGWSDGRTSYLIPVNAPRSARTEVLKNISLSLNGSGSVLDQIGQKGASSQLAIIDACRENLLERDGFRGGLTRGLGPVTPPSGAFIIYSAGAEQLALDRLYDGDPSPYSVFSREFIPLLKSDLPLQQAIKQAQTRVSELARLARPAPHVQNPAYYDGIMGDFCLSGACRPQPSSDPCTNVHSPAGWRCVARDGVAQFEAEPPPRREPEPVQTLVAPAPVPVAESPTPVENSLVHDEARSAPSSISPTSPNNNTLPQLLPEPNSLAARYLARARAGHVAEMAGLGSSYEHGNNGAPQSDAEATRWYRLAIEKGEEDGISLKWHDEIGKNVLIAMSNLALMYEDGRGVSQDKKKAFQIYLKAAENGHPGAMIKTAQMYESGHGAPRDMEEARRFYIQAINLGWDYPGAWVAREALDRLNGK